ncbi:hypothetical protein M514_02060, partial [Trichuris suis]
LAVYQQAFSDLTSVSASEYVSLLRTYGILAFELHKMLAHLLSKLQLLLCNEGLSAAVAAEEIQALRGEEALSDRAARKWFFRLREGNFDLSDSARSSDFDEERLNALTREEP